MSKNPQSEKKETTVQVEQELATCPQETILCQPQLQIQTQNNIESTATTKIYPTVPPTEESPKHFFALNPQYSTKN